MPVGSVAGYIRMAKACNCDIPQWFIDSFDGLDKTPDVRDLVAASVASDICTKLQNEGVEHFHFYTLNKSALTLATCRRLGVSLDNSQGEAA